MTHTAPLPPFRDRLFRAVRWTMNTFALFGIYFLTYDPTMLQQAPYALFREALVFPIYAVYILHLLLAFLRATRITEFLQVEAIDLILFAPLLFLTFGGIHPAHILLLRQVLHYFRRYLNNNTLINLAETMTEQPARLISWSFAGIILIGTVLLLLPVSVVPEHDPSLLTALFTSTSAVCVTGLIVVDTGTYFAPFGQLVILGLIQIGGLGIMSLSAGVAILIGKRMAISQRTIMQNVLDQSDLASLRQILSDLFRWTFLFEAVGALIIGCRLWMVTDTPFADALFSGVFHSISAFCNAGFSLYANSFVDFVDDPILNLTLMMLITLGGIGFRVLGFCHCLSLGRRPRETPGRHHTALAVGTSLFLVVIGTLFFFSLEADSAELSRFGLMDQLMASLFQSVTTRTAGFNTIDIGALQTSTLFFLCLLMFVGASPGSTGGGIKTTTLATMLLSLVSQMRGTPEVVFWERTIPKDTVLKAFLITAISAGLVACFTFSLTLLEDAPLINLLFETVSAFATVGLSTGITGSLCSTSRVLIVILMFIGRIGPLTMALTIHQRSDSGSIQYPETRILVG